MHLGIKVTRFTKIHLGIKVTRFTKIHLGIKVLSTEHSVTPCLCVMHTGN